MQEFHTGRVVVGALLVVTRLKSINCQAINLTQMWQEFTVAANTIFIE
jgi:hypothetical protein